MSQNVYIVTMSDGTLLHCEPRYVGPSHDPICYRWSIMRAPDGTQFIGPIVQQDPSPRAIQMLIEEWWEMKKGLGQAEKS